MTDKTYVAVAPDGSEHARTSHRDYTHAVLVEGSNGWRAAGFCGRLDLAEKKAASEEQGIVVEVTTRATRDPLDLGEEEVKSGKPKPTIGALVERLVTESAMDYAQVVEEVLRAFPDAKTTARSVASTAARLRRQGVDVPRRSGRRPVNGQ